MRDSAAVNGSRSARWFWSFFRSHRNYMSHKRLRPECRVQNSWEVFCCVIEVETRVQSAELLGEFFIVLLRFAALPATLLTFSENLSFGCYTLSRVCVICFGPNCCGCSAISNG
ncbi:uncharacterized protein LOC107639328 isoform X2 [Arachis ipaensis]|uniref:uncharacterized protein LOC107639328 isoform X2 n=1 Tax=Arachis ipaensis TaxID=130454 RepID=UPI000A2B6F56|nr:uncharacterized protein LOC107639328 isoform X2 [Arachis ipaensis]XP_020976824.1 uncharacterized protein LOC107639328 isoform X2 [Arachis ipaensis]